jgi:hypothetical protein
MRSEGRVWIPDATFISAVGRICHPHRRWPCDARLFRDQETLTFASWREVLLGPLREPRVIWARARLQRPELRLVLSLPAAVLLLERLQRFLRRRDDGALQRL